MDARIPGAIGAVVVLAAGGWLAVEGLEAAWAGSRPVNEAQPLDLESYEEALIAEPAPSPTPPSKAPDAISGEAAAVVAANTPRGERQEPFNAGVLGKGGTIYWVHGDSAYGSNGVSAQRYGPVTYVQEPGGKIARYETFGDTTYGPSGIVAQKSGNTTYVTGEDGRITTCVTAGAHTNC